MNIYSYHEGEVEVLKGQSPYNLPLISELFLNLASGDQGLFQVDVPGIECLTYYSPFYTELL